MIQRITIHTYIYIYINMYIYIYYIYLDIFILYIHTYITGHYNPSVCIIDLVSHTTYDLCVIFIHMRRDLQFKVDSERQIF